MPQIKQIATYTFDELSDESKERARAWYRDGAFDYDWWDAIYEDAERIGHILGISFEQRRDSKQPCIWFSGFYSQGDGASFDGYYSYAKQAVRKIKDYAPRDKELHRIALELQEIQSHNRYALTANIKASTHYHSLTVDVFNDGGYADGDTADAISQAMRDFADWIYRQLKAEYEYQCADKQVDEAIKMNGYNFYEDGTVT